MVIILVGPPGAGKTTVARIVCERVKEAQGYPTLHLEVDNLRWMVIGDVKDHGPEAVWIKLCEGLLDIAVTNVEFVLVEGLFFQVEALIHLKNTYRATVIRLEVALETALRRNQERQLVDERLAATEVRSLYSLPRLADAIQVDGARSAVEVADDIIGIIAGRPDGPIYTHSGLR